jgi:hypothetical protein
MHISIGLCAMILSYWSGMMAINSSLTTMNNPDTQQLVTNDPMTLQIHPKDNKGCDALIESCGAKGGCCDEHDECYRINKCTAVSWLLLGMFLF